MGQGIQLPTNAVVLDKDEEIFFVQLNKIIVGPRMLSLHVSYQRLTDPVLSLDLGLRFLTLVVVDRLPLIESCLFLISPHLNFR